MPADPGVETPDEVEKYSDLFTALIRYFNDGRPDRTAGHLNMQQRSKRRRNITHRYDAVCKSWFNFPSHPNQRNVRVIRVPCAMGGSFQTTIFPGGLRYYIEITSAFYIIPFYKHGFER